MRLIHSDIDQREAAALAHYRAAQQRQQQLQTHETATPSTRGPGPRRDASAERDYVGRPIPRGSRLPERKTLEAAPTWVSYTVQRGDTLRGIADWFYGDRSRWLAIFAVNRSAILDPLALVGGTELIIPRRRGSNQLA